jgi:hypothetical protein
MSGVRLLARKVYKGCLFNFCHFNLFQHQQLPSSSHLRRLFSSSSPIMSNRPDITLYTAQTPNGIKISIALEELGYVAAPVTSTSTILPQF